MKPEFDRDKAMCQNCIYWNANQFSDLKEWNGDEVNLYMVGDCKFHPPVVNFTGKKLNCIQPETTFYNWCGQFQMNPNAKIGFCNNITNKQNLPYFDTPESHCKLFTVLMDALHMGALHMGAS